MLLTCRLCGHGERPEDRRVVLGLLGVPPTERCLLPRGWRFSRCFVVLVWNGESEAVGARPLVSPRDGLFHMGLITGDIVSFYFMPIIQLLFDPSH